MTEVHLKELDQQLPDFAVSTPATGPVQAIERIELARATLPNGAVYAVVATKHNRDWPGTDSNVTFSVESWEHRGGAMMATKAWGFFEETGAYRFLTTKRPFAYTNYDLQGNTSEEVRSGLGVPDAYVVRDVENVSTVDMVRDVLDELHS